MTGDRQALIAQAKRLKDFNLNPGDKVKTRHEDGRREMYRVDEVYNFIFTVTSLDTGVKSSFPKVDYLTGVVRRCQ